MRTSNPDVTHLPACRTRAGRVELLTFNRDMSANLKAIVEAAVAESDNPAEAAAKLGVEPDELAGVARRFKVKLPWPATSDRLAIASTTLRSHGIACERRGGKLILDLAAAERVAQLLGDLQKIEDRGCV